MEIESVDEGIRRYERNREGREAATLNPEMHLISRNLDALIPAVEDVQKRAANKEAMKGVRNWGVPLLSVPAKRLAFISLVEMVNGHGLGFTDTSFRLAKRVRQERYHEIIKRTHKNAITQAKRFRRQWSERAFNELRTKTQTVEEPWAPFKSLWVGAVLIELVLNNTDCFRKGKVRTDGGYLMDSIELLPHVVEDLRQQHDRLSLLRPVHLPMVVPPRKPETLYDGGYLIGEDRESCKSPVVKTSFRSKSEITDLVQAGIHGDAVYYLSQTQWAIHPVVLDTQESIFKTSSRIAGMLGEELEPLPPMPPKESPDEVWKEYNLKASRIYKKNEESVGERHNTLFDLSEAKRFKKYPALYHTWECDGRGRMYPKNTLSPQGSDRARSLLQFNRAQPLGERGFRWLTVHLANSMGEDKCTFDERVVFVNDHRDEILRWASDPLGHTGWADTDKPFSTLSAALEWAECVDDRDRDKYPSRTRVAQDGSTNGLQHLSALARDSVGALATNLIPSDRPQDLYSQVLSKVNEKIKEDIAAWRRAGCPSLTDTPEKDWPLALPAKYMEAALHWEGNAERGTVKRGVMTTPYSVTPSGIRAQLVCDGFCDGIQGSLYYNSTYMRDCIVYGVRESVRKASEVMEWLKEIVRIASDEEKTIHWTNPAGFRVDQAYMKPSRRKITTASRDYRYRVFDAGEAPLHRKKQVNSVAPNYTHSVDGAHMAATVVDLYESGIVDMGMIHDSFSVHACHVDTMREKILENFVEIHKEPLLDILHEEMSEQLETPIPPPPECGDFDVSDVLQSEYAFH